MRKIGSKLVNLTGSSPVSSSREGSTRITCNETRDQGKYSRKFIYREAPPWDPTPSPFVYFNEQRYQRTSSITRRDFNQKTSIICSVHVVAGVKIIRLPNPFLYLNLWIPFMYVNFWILYPYTIPWAWEKHPFRAEPHCIEHYREYPRDMRAHWDLYRRAFILEQGWPGDESARLPPVWPCSSIPAWCHRWDELVFLRVFLRVLRFSYLQKKQHFQIPIPPG